MAKYYILPSFPTCGAYDLLMGQADIRDVRVRRTSRRIVTPNDAVFEGIE